MSGKVNDLNKDISNNVDLEESYDSKKANKYMKEAIKQVCFNRRSANWLCNCLSGQDNRSWLQSKNG